MKLFVSWRANGYAVVILPNLSWTLARFDAADKRAQIFILRMFFFFFFVGKLLAMIRSELST